MRVILDVGRHHVPPIEPSEWIRNLRQPPRLEKLTAHPWVQLLDEVARQRSASDQLLDIDEVLGTMRRDHPGGELELDVAREGKEREAISTHGGGGRIRKSNRLRHVVSRIASCAQDVDVHAVYRVEEFARARNALDVALAQVSLLEGLQILVAHDQIDVDSDTPVSVFVQGERPDDGVRQAFFLENGGQPVEGVLRLRHPHEKSPTVFDAGNEARLCLRREPSSTPTVSSPRCAAVAFGMGLGRGDVDRHDQGMLAPAGMRDQRPSG
jgi:hypothetical protein